MATKKKKVETKVVSKESKALEGHFVQAGEFKSEKKTIKKTVTLKTPAQSRRIKGTFQVDSTLARNDSDALEGHFVQVVSGKYEGRYGVFMNAVEYGSDKYPTKISVRTRDAENELITVDYKDTRRAKSGVR